MCSIGCLNDYVGESRSSHAALKPILVNLFGSVKQVALIYRDESASAFTRVHHVARHGASLAADDLSLSSRANIVAVWFA